MFNFFQPKQPKQPKQRGCETAAVKKGDGLSELSKNGYQFLKENNFENARNCFSKIIELNSSNNYALVGMGDIFRKMRMFKDAAAYYEKCLEYYPENNYALFGLGDSYKELNNYNKAIEMWLRYLEHDSVNISVLTRIANAYRKVHDFAKSKTAYNRVLDLSKNNEYAIIGLGYLHYDLKEYRDALFYWGKMIKLHSRAKVDIRILTSAGNCHRKLQDFSEGIKCFEDVLKRDANNFYALFGLGDCYRGLGKPAAALEYWNILLKKKNNNKMILTRAGDAYCSLKDYDNASSFYKRALDVEFDIYAVLGLCVIDRIHKRFDSAISSLRLLIKKHKCRNFRVFIELASCREETGDIKGAVEVLREFQSLGMHCAAVTEKLKKLGG